MSNWAGKSIQIVTFAVPYPPDYGGVIDVFYKIKTLAEMGVKVHLHAYTYQGHMPAPALNQYCASVQYYPRAITSKYIQGWPYIVASRYNKHLVSNVLSAGHPVLVEGLHCAFLLPFLKEKGIAHALRLHNVEWLYYKLLAEGERSLVKKKYFLEESARLKSYERILSKTNLLTLSPVDTQYAEAQFPGARVREVFPFHPFNGLEVLEGRGSFALFHGNLSVNENEAAALWLLEQVFSKLNHPLVIAGKSPSRALELAVNARPHVTLLANPDAAKMKMLQQSAQFHLLPNTQPTGMKLKWANALHTGRFLIAHPDMAGAGCERAGIFSGKDAESYLDVLMRFQEQPFTQSFCEERIAYLGSRWINQLNAEAVMEELFRY
jgi:hypothetical protein